MPTFAEKEEDVRTLVPTVIPNAPHPMARKLYVVKSDVERYGEIAGCLGYTPVALLHSLGVDQRPNIIGSVALVCSNAMLTTRTKSKGQGIRGTYSSTANYHMPRSSITKELAQFLSRTVRKV